MKRMFCDNALAFTLSPPVLLSPRQVKGIVKTVLWLMCKQDGRKAEAKRNMIVSGDVGRNAFHIVIDIELSPVKQKLFFITLLELLERNELSKKQNRSRVLRLSNNEGNGFVEYAYGSHHSYAHNFIVSY